MRNFKIKTKNLLLSILTIEGIVGITLSLLYIVGIYSWITYILIIGFTLINIFKEKLDFEENSIIGKSYKFGNKVVKIMCLVILISLCMKLAGYKILTKTVTTKITKTERVDKRYLVYTTEGVYKCEDIPLLFKYNSSDVYSKLRSGDSVTFKATGIRSRIFSNYPNIIKIIN